jgi:hypothetical protein
MRKIKDEGRNGGMRKRNRKQSKHIKTLFMHMFGCLNLFLNLSKKRVLSNNQKNISSSENRIISCVEVENC